MFFFLNLGKAIKKIVLVAAGAGEANSLLASQSTSSGNEEPFPYFYLVFFMIPFFTQYSVVISKVRLICRLNKGKF